MASVAGFRVRTVGSGIDSVEVLFTPSRGALGLLTPDEAIELADALVQAAKKLDPWAEAKFRGLEGSRSIKANMWRMKSWHKIPNFKEALKALKEKEGRDLDDFEVYSFFSSKDTVVGPWEPIPLELTKAQEKCRSPIQALREGDVESCMRAINLHGEMGS